MRRGSKDSTASDSGANAVDTVQRFLDGLLPGALQRCNEVCTLKSQSGENAAGTGEDGEAQKSRGLQHYYEALANRAQASWICGGNTVDYINAGDLAEGAQHGRKGAKRSGKTEIVFDPPLANITDSYNFVKGTQMGILKLAVHRESRQRCAVLPLLKSKIPAGVTDNPGIEIKKHLETLLKIDHVNILAMHEACEDARFLYLIYDWPEGGLLLHHLCSYHDDVTEAHLSGIIREIMGAICAAGKFNMHHLDWSLMCLFLGYKDRFSPLKVFGVGLAGMLVPLCTSRKYSRSNKHFYVAPEIIVERVSVENHLMPHNKLQSCDIWSVGALLYMMFSGRPPFSGKFDEVLEKIRRGRFKFGHEFDLNSREAKNVIELMLTKKWELRPTAAGLLKHPFLQQVIGARKKEGVVCQDALSKLDQFARETHCKQTLARLLADLGLQENQYSDLEERFRQLDLDGNGVVEMTELCEVAGTLPNVDPDTIAAIVKTCDRNGNSTIDISEFVAAVVLELENKDERLLIKAFERMDMNRDARITKGEIFRVLRQYSGTLEATDVSNFVKNVDQDADHKIDYSEFKKLFPHMADRNEEIRGRLTKIKDEKETQEKSWKHILDSLDRFYISLKVAAGRCALQHDKLQKSGMNEKELQEKVGQVAEAVRELAGKAEILFNSTAKAEKERKKAGLTGLTVMHAYQKEVGSGVDKSGSGSGSDSDDLALEVAQGRKAAGGNQDDLKPDGTSQVDLKPVADIYVGRGAVHRELTSKQFRAEVNRQRRYIWLGGGEGVRHVRANVLMETGTGDASRHTLADPSSARAHHQRDDDNISEPMSPTGNSGSGSDVDPGSPTGEGPKGRLTMMPEDGNEGEDDDDDEEDPEVSIRNAYKPVPWTRDNKKMKWAKRCMTLAGGPQIVKIGRLDPEDQAKKLKSTAKRLIGEYSLPWSVGEELCDLHKLMSYKCARSWLPPLIVLQGEMRLAMDESKVHMSERRTVHLTGVKYVIQLCERIMFSLIDFTLWQQESLNAMCSLERECQAPIASRRFLPHRVGELDENARTPRDDEDAKSLAPAEPEPGLRNFVTASVNDPNASQQDGLRMTSSQMNPGADGAPSAATGLSQSFAGSMLGRLDPGHHESKRLDRNGVRAQHAKTDPRGDARLRTAAQQAHQQTLHTMSVMKFS